MKVFVLALDGLEYELVNRWDLRSLKQKYHGFYLISEEYCRHGVPYSPPVWASIITGKAPSEHGISEWWKYSSILNRLRWLPPFKWIRGKRRVLWRLGIKPRIVSSQDLNYPTIFDEIENSVAVNIPCYNEPTELHRRLSLAALRSIKEYEQEIWRIHQERVDKTITLLKTKNWSLFMTYFDLADLIGHIHYIKHLEKVQQAYMILNDLALKLQRMVKSVKSAFLIISDHGMMPSEDGVTGNHSMRAFWSLNINPPFIPRDPVDIYKLIKRLIEEKY